MKWIKRDKFDQSDGPSRLCGAWLTHSVDISDLVSVICQMSESQPGPDMRAPGTYEVSEDDEGNMDHPRGWEFWHETGIVVFECSRQSPCSFNCMKCEIGRLQERRKYENLEVKDQYSWSGCNGSRYRHSEQCRYPSYENIPMKKI